MRRRWLLGAALAVLMASVGGSHALVARASSAVGHDISWPQCSSSFPRGGSFGIVGVNDGIAWSQNPCLQAEYRWAASLPNAPALYMNTADPGPQSHHWALGGPRTASCDPANSDANSAAFAACAYDYGWNTALDALTNEAAPVPTPAGRVWWLDVETTNTWKGSTAANAQDVQGSLDALHARGVATVGVYSTGYQWGAITGGYAFAQYTPSWVAGASGSRQAQSACLQRPYAGAASPIKLSQYQSAGFDVDLTC